MRLYIAILTLSGWVTVICAQKTSIAEARLQPEGTFLTVSGIVTNGNELGSVRFLQDKTGGIAASPGEGAASRFDLDVKAGDSVEVTGMLMRHNEVLTISPVRKYRIISTDNPLPKPIDVSLGFNLDWADCQLVKVHCLTFGRGGEAFLTGGNYDIAEAERRKSRLFIRAGHPLIGTAMPGDPIVLTAILTRCPEGHQLLLRKRQDMLHVPCFYFSKPVTYTQVQKNAVTLTWQVNTHAHGKISYGTTPQSLCHEQTVENGINYAILKDLKPATTYWVQLMAMTDFDTIKSEVVPVTTQSDTKGDIQVYFSKSINNSYIATQKPAGTTIQELVKSITDRIDAARTSIEVCLYKNEWPEVQQALANAADRGVVIRHIADMNDVSNVANKKYMVYKRPENGRMHANFMVIDASISDGAWVMSTTRSLILQRRETSVFSTVWIQDQALARAFHAEFEEMWGGSGTQPNPGLSKFGANKTDNIPHLYKVGDTEIELYFSGADNHYHQMTKTIMEARQELLFGAHSFTSDTLSWAITLPYNLGAKLRGLIDIADQKGGEYRNLTSQGIELLQYRGNGGFEHQYMVLDAQARAPMPVLITGSTKWEDKTPNDEHILIIRDRDLAYLYKAEFEKRWAETFNPTKESWIAPIVIGPNPVTNVLEVFCIANAEFVITDQKGALYLQGALEKSIMRKVDVSQFPIGHYNISIKRPDGTDTFSFQKI